MPQEMATAVVACARAKVRTCGGAKAERGGGGVHLEDESLLAAVWLRELDLPVEPARPEQGRVERVLPIRRHDHLHAACAPVNALRSGTTPPETSTAGAALAPARLRLGHMRSKVPSEERRHILLSLTEALADRNRRNMNRHRARMKPQSDEAAR